MNSLPLIGLRIIWTMLRVILGSKPTEKKEVLSKNYSISNLSMEIQKLRA